MLTGYSSQVRDSVPLVSVWSLSQYSDSDIMGWMCFCVSVSYGQTSPPCCLFGAAPQVTPRLICVTDECYPVHCSSTAELVRVVDQDLGGLPGWRSVLGSVWEVKGIIDCSNWWSWFPGSMCLCASCWHRWLWSSAVINTLDTGISIRSGPCFSDEVMGEKPRWSAREQT